MRPTAAGCCHGNDDDGRDGGGKDACCSNPFITSRADCSTVADTIGSSSLSSDSSRTGVGLPNVAIGGTIMLVDNAAMSLIALANG